MYDFSENIWEILNKMSFGGGYFSLCGFKKIIGHTFLPLIARFPITAVRYASTIGSEVELVKIIVSAVLVPFGQIL